MAHEQTRSTETPQTDGQVRNSWNASDPGSGMPMKRSNTTRSTSRSPAPPTPILTPTTPRQFLPPSHYAAAGGFLNTPSVSPYSSRAGKRSQNSAGGGDKPSLPEPSSSQSSLEEQSRKEHHSRLGSSLKRSSSGFPDLEPQLLPSLRDTIDRMTRPPSRTSPAPTPSYASSSKRDNRPHKRTSSPRPLHDLLPGPGDNRADIGQETRQYYSPMTEPIIPNPPRSYSNQATPVLGSHNTTPKIPVKSALKSSIRTPAVRLFSPQPAGSTHGSPPSGGALRSMKSLIRRKSHGIKSSIRNQDYHPTSRDPEPYEGSTSRYGPEPYEESYWGAESPQGTEKPPNYNVASSKNKSFQSHIPRPRSRAAQGTPSHGSREDSSDLERRYADESRDRRKLTVANAEVGLSASSSESESGSHQTPKPSHSHSSRQPTSDCSRGRSVGLGLTLPHGPRGNNDHNPRQLWDSNRIRNHQIGPVPQEKTLRFSLPPSDSTESAYSSDEPGGIHFDGSRMSQGTGDLDADHARRRAAFMTAVSDLGELELSPHPQNNSQHRKGSRDRHSKSISPQPPRRHLDEQESDYDDGSRYRRTKKERRRSSSHSPRYLSQPEEDSDYVPVIPLRSRSVNRNYPSQSPPAAAFPENLKDLLKSRTSFSKSPALCQNTNPAPSDDVDHPIRGKASGSQSHRQSKGITNHETHCQYDREERSTHRSPDLSHLTEALFAQQSVAAKERRALGIPPSSSDEFYHDAEQKHRRTSLAESNTSFLDNIVWEEEQEQERLTTGAENLFRKRSGTSTNEVSCGNQQSMHDTPRLAGTLPNQRRLSTSAFEGTPVEKHKWDRRAIDLQVDTPKPQAPKYVLPPPQVASAPQNRPKTREGVIQELFETEEELLRQLHTCMKMFVLPLRVQDSRAWIAGVPPNIARLLDWFDDIVNLHEQIYHSLCTARDTQSPTTDRVSESLRCFVLKVEVYQPYLVRLADVSGEIVSAMRLNESDFGQFLNLQERLPDCGGLTLESLLVLPVHRLAAYQDLFSRMLDLTPKGHQDYISTFSLSRATDMVVRIMTEVKIREHEYKLIKLFSKRMQGLSTSNQLATRERRLLHSGTLAFIRPGDHGQFHGSEKPPKSSNDTKPRDTPASSWKPKGKKSSSKRLSDTSTLLAESSTKTSWFSRLPLRRKKPRPKSVAKETTSDENDTASILTLEQQYPDSVLVQAFVFNDLVLLAQLQSGTENDPRWTLVQDFGLFRPLSIARLDRSAQGTASVSLEILSVDRDHLNDGTDFRSAPYQVVDLVLQLSPAEDSDGTPLDSDEVLQQWLMAFRQCSQTTLRKLTFPSYHDALYNGSDEILDTHLAVSSLVGSGLPLPKSPSGQGPETWNLEEEHGGGDEREERGWWSLRYQQVFREFQRQDLLLCDEDDENDHTL